MSRVGMMHRDTSLSSKESENSFPVDAGLYVFRLQNAVHRKYIQTERLFLGFFKEDLLNFFSKISFSEISIFTIFLFWTF